MSFWTPIRNGTFNLERGIKHKYNYWRILTDIDAYLRNIDIGLIRIQFIVNIINA